jgi:hypothetical protein
VKNIKLVVLLALSVPLIILSCKKSSTPSGHHYTSTNTSTIEITPIAVIDSSTAYQWVIKVSFSYTASAAVDSVTFTDHITYDVYDGGLFKFTEYDPALTQGIIHRDTITNTIANLNIQNIQSSNVTYVSNGSVEWFFALYGPGIPSN